MSGLTRSIGPEDLEVDFPLGCHAPDTLPNVAVESLAAEGTACLSGVRGEYGYPVLQQVALQRAARRGIPVDDLNLELALMTRLEHTARLAGPKVKQMVAGDTASVLRIEAQPVTYHGSKIPLSNPIVRPLQPQPPGPNVWYWRDFSSGEELIFTVQVEFQPHSVGLRVGHVYQLSCTWEFWDRSTRPPLSLRLFGRHDSLSFGVVRKARPHL